MKYITYTYTINHMLHIMPNTTEKGHTTIHYLQQKKRVFYSPEAIAADPRWLCDIRA